MSGESSPGVAGREDGDSAVPRALPDLARELTGDLPCVGCGYNLKSQSIRGVCPECGTAVRVTLLARVDPMADVLRPITYPTLTAVSLMVWTLAALVAAVLTWALRATDAWVVMFDASAPSVGPLVIVATTSIILSGFGALVFIRPHSGIRIQKKLWAAAGVLAIFGFAFVYWRIHARFDPVHARPYFYGHGGIAERHTLRLIGSALLVLAALGLRPNMRLLAARSLVMRMGRVDRQTMMALAAAVFIAALGDTLHLLGGRTYGTAAGILATAGTTLIAIGSMLFTVGLVGMFIDALRLVPVILRPPLTMAQLIGPAPEERSRDGRGT
jgi:hypothetical protein